MRTVLNQFEHYINLSKKVTPETLAAVSDIDEPGRLADVICSHLPLKIKDKQEILETIDVRERLEKLLDILNNEREVLELNVRSANVSRNKWRKPRRNIICVSK